MGTVCTLQVGLVPGSGVLVRRLHLDLMRLSSSGCYPRDHSPGNDRTR